MQLYHLFSLLAVVKVISRIFYSVDRSWNNRITVADLRRSNFLQVRERERERERERVTL